MTILISVSMLYQRKNLFQPLSFFNHILLICTQNSNLDFQFMIPVIRNFQDSEKSRPVNQESINKS